MSIEAFEFKLNNISPKEVWDTETAYTEVITIEQFEKEFCGALPTFEKNWDRVEQLLQDPYFRDLLSEDTERYHNQGNFDRKISTIDLGILGFAWCSGTKEQKAQFLFNLAKT